MSTPNGFIIANRYLNEIEMKNNGQYIGNYLASHGMSHDAIVGILGNMCRESHCTTGIMQSLAHYDYNSSGGFGLVQWTPVRKIGDYAESIGINKYDYNAMCDFDMQMGRIVYEKDNNIQWNTAKGYGTFAEFWTTSKGYEWATEAWCMAYEQPGDVALAERLQYAEWFKDYSFNGDIPTPPEPPDPPIDPPEPPTENNLYELLSQTAYNLKRIADNKSTLESLKVGDSCRIKQLYTHPKRLLFNCYGGKLTQLKDTYNIIAVRRDGKIVLRYSNGFLIYVDPTLLEKE